MESDWYIWFFLILCVAGTTYWYRHKKDDTKFIHDLIQYLKKPYSYHQLHVSTVPTKFIQLYQALQYFIATLPIPNDKDKLTGFSNRLGLKSKFMSLMPLTQGTLVLIDIYRFRFVNDLFGFSVGDKLLLSLSKRLTALDEEVTFLARMNEDEFLLYFDSDRTEETLLAIRNQLQAPFEIDDTPITVQIQMGYLDLKQHHTDVSQLLRRLDLALIKAKQDKYFFAGYMKGDDVSQHRQLSIINRLPKALASGELYMVYQPKLTISDGRCVQVEALMRWEHHQFGVLSPAEFIPLVECAGMIKLVSQWALDQVISQQAKWRQSGLHMQVAVNLSTQDLISGTLCDDIQAKLQRHRVDASTLSIEITESTLMGDMDTAIQTISKLKQVGVDVAIDDFGTGHSSLAYLKNFPVDEVKIDKAFIDDLLVDSRALHIMKCSIELAKGLAFKVTVEGVETEEIYLALMKMGVDKIQGDLFAKPMSAKVLEGCWGQLQQSRLPRIGGDGDRGN
ncbi:putative bifunctional diguanylate cyclase/phosphodiesterase [Shewanella atlantica]|uniref:GGDEF domain-containing protein n=1 Tax=Shewanella atlantica TaxID=271099 RepID=A0A3S0K084_9GAMM|nr:bifunctional diguanylate cyclase/phosphodiesterase [Shewanella atlantica]RTR32817.1 GGDEF domain-containing protein [Shewanella atlantica]